MPRLWGSSCRQFASHDTSNLRLCRKEFITYAHTYALDGILTRDFHATSPCSCDGSRVVILRLEGGLPIRPDCDSVTHGNVAIAFVQLGAAFDMKRGRRHAALTSHGISPAARRARERGPGAAPPAAAMAGSLPPMRIRTPVRVNSQVPGLCAVPLPNSGRTHLAVRLTGR
jgi:hypothetical protein